MSIMYNDKPISNAEHFNFDSYSEAISKIVLEKNNKTPISIAINGKWGSGKTTLMKTIRQKLIDKSGEGDYRKTRTVWFNAWKYTETDSMLAALILELFEEMGREGVIEKVRRMVMEGSERINLLKQMSDLSKILTLGIGAEFDKWIDNPAYKEKLSFFDLFQDYMEKILLGFVLNKEEGEYTDKEGVLVIFIDDLDRCSPKNVTQVMESINLFLDQKGCFFIFGMDMSVISKAIEVPYKDYGVSGRDYIKKMIHLQFNLPEIQEIDIKKFMTQELMIGGTLKNYINIIAKGLEPNKREIKRFLNSLNLMRMLGESIKNLNYNEELLIKWTILTFSAEDFINETKKNHNLFLNIQSVSDKRKPDREKFLKQLSEEDQKLYRRFIHDKRILNVLKIGDESFTKTDIPHYIFLSSVAPKEAEEIEKIEIGPGVNLAGVDLEGEDLTRSVLRGANLRNANLAEADLSEADLAGANLNTANLDQADLRRANLERTSIRGANLEEADLEDATLLMADLKGSNLRDADLSRAYLRGANFTLTNMVRADMNRADLEGATLMGAYLDGADLRTANLSGANLKGAKLNGANLESAILTDTNFKQVNFDEKCLKTILSSQNWESAIFDPEIRKKLEDMKK